MKLFVTKGAAVNLEKLKAAGHQIMATPVKADIAICWKTPESSTLRSRTILMQSEPPVSGSRVKLYQEHGEFLAVFCYDPKRPNEYALTTTPAYPYRPAFALWESLACKPEPTGTGAYFAGRRQWSADGWLQGGYRQYGRRQAIAKQLQEQMGGWCLGEGWPESTKEGGWHANKRDDIDVLDPDYMFAAENCILPNYVSEKFWDGMLCGRPMIYSGYFLGGAMLKIDDEGQVAGMVDRLQGMTTGEYESHGREQREWAQPFKGAWEAERDQRTSEILAIIGM